MRNVLILPWRGWPVILLCMIYLLAGVIDHDPWKTGDAVNLGVAFEFAKHGQWLTPRIGHEVWLGTPPLFHWSAALLGNLLAPLLPFHIAARLASTVFGILLLAALAIASGKLEGSDTISWGTPLIPIGMLGLLVPIHDAEPLIALLAAQAWLFLGISMLDKQPVRGGIIGAISLACGFLATGFTALLYLLPILVTPVLNAEWRTYRTAAGLVIILSLGALLGSVWPIALYYTTPDTFSHWLNAELAKLSIRALSLQSISSHLELLGWAAWPVFPLCLWTLWGRQKHLLTPQILLPLAAGGMILFALFLFSPPQALQHLVLLVPITLLASAGIDRLRRGAANALDWFGMMTFTLIAGLIWLGAVSMDTGTPARVAKNFLKAEPGFIGEIRPLAYTVALLLTLAWLWQSIRLPKSPWRSITTWATGMTVMWSLLAILWMPWIDYGRSYRPVAQSLAQKLEENEGCVAQKGLGEGQKASLRYFQNIITQPLADKGTPCPWLLTQSGNRKDSVPEGWKRVWEGYRPGDRSERLRLYHRK